MERDNSISMDATLEKLTLRKQPSKSGFFVIIFLYLLVSVFTTMTARSSNSVVVLGVDVPMTAFTGVFSAAINICMIFLVVFYRKIGLITSIFLIVIQFPMIIINFLIRHNTSSIPGLFTNLFTILALIILYINGIRVSKYQRSIRAQAITDSLTGLPNRFACTELINNLVKRDIGFTVVSVDLNNFKNINDTMGHDVGNKILVEIAHRWKALADSWESSTVDFVTRLGGDEFAIIIREYKFDKDILGTINRYKDELEKVITIDECDYYMSACFGYAEYPTDVKNGALVLAYADAALHEIKRQNSSNCILHYTKDLTMTDKTLDIERKIRVALDADSVYFNLQPQYDMSHNLRGFEALARMKDSEGDIISPGEFIPIAEATGLIDKIDLRVLSKAAKFVSDIVKEKETDILVSFNVSVKHLMKNNFIDEIMSILDEYKVTPAHFELEVTESIMIDSTDTALQKINEAKNLGFKIAIDDFGTGYSSLSYLNRLPADILKIDKSFIDEMNSSESSKQYVASIISIGRVMNLEIISEGVETADQLDTLKEIGCDYIQGYIWGRPMPPEEAIKLV